MLSFSKLVAVTKAFDSKTKGASIPKNPMVLTLAGHFVSDGSFVILSNGMTVIESRVSNSSKYSNGKYLKK